MRETFTYGSVRGAAGNGGPYRDQWPGLLGPAYELVRKAGSSPFSCGACAIVIVERPNLSAWRQACVGKSSLRPSRVAM